MAIIQLKDVKKTYPLGKTEVKAVKGVSFDIGKGDFISIAGPSGSGKSTILNMIGCIDTPSEGTVEILGTETGAVGLGNWEKHKPNELSGGQRQRVAIARALVTKPQIILADEPTANLDSKTGETIIELMKKMNSELMTTFIFATHDSAIVEIADHVIRLHDGRIEKNFKTNTDQGKVTGRA